MMKNATVLIVTKNRKEELQRAVQSALNQKIPLEILIIDDGSTDGTGEMISKLFPTARLISHRESAGCVVRRNEGIQQASGAIVFSLDDDAAFTSPHTAEEIIEEFSHPRVGAVAIPMIDVNKGFTVHQQAPGADGFYVTANFIGAAHALRKDVFLKLGGYREFIGHQGEEMDFCIRLLEAGYLVKLGRTKPIHHFESPRRDFRKMDVYGRRNDLLFEWYYTPLAYLPWRIAAVFWKGIHWGCRTGRLRNMLEGLWMGCQGIQKQKKQRRPVSHSIFWLYRKLKNRAAVPLPEIEFRLPRFSIGQSFDGIPSLPFAVKPAVTHG